MQDRDRHAIAHVACPVCGAAPGQPCARRVDPETRTREARPSPLHTARRRAWQAHRDEQLRKKA
jgi:hypothetical protein